MKEEKRRWIVRRAREMLGIPYKVGTKYNDTPHVFDCSKLVWYIFQEIGIELKGKAIRQAQKGRTIEPKIELLKRGDLMFIRSTRGFYSEEFPDGIGHVGIYVGDGQVISARKKQGMVVEEDVTIYLAPEEFRVFKRVI